MRIIKYLFWGLLATIALILITAIFAGRKISYQKSVHIYALPEKIWSKVSTIKGIYFWNPWISKDPEMNVLISGEDGKVGAKLCWDSKKSAVGKGCQTLKKLEPGKLAESRLQLYSPYSVDAVMYIKIEPAAVYGSVVTWGFTGELPYILRIIRLFTGANRYLEKSCAEGLSQLKQLCEKR